MSRNVWAFVLRVRVFLECVAKGSGVILGVIGALFVTRCLNDRNRCQPFATVRVGGSSWGVLDGSVTGQIRVK